MQVVFSNKGSTLIARLSGELHHHSADYVRQKIDAEIMKATTRNLVIDFGNVTFMDSSGIGVVMGRYKNITRMNGKAAIVAVNPQIRRVLEVSGIGRLMPVYDKCEEALKHLA